MKKIFLSATAIAATLSTPAFAADLPSRKAPAIAVQAPLWTGFYAGLNIGYGFGTNSNANSVGYGIGGAPIAGANLQWAGLNFGNASQYNSSLAGAGLAQSVSMSNDQSGVVGGGQIGYNYQLKSDIVIGLEADIQGSGIQSNGYNNGAGASGVNNLIDLIRDDGLGTQARFYNGSQISISNAFGTQTLNTGVNWLGTVRGRIGYLINPSLLAYGTGGLTYGGVFANASSLTGNSVVNSYNYTAEAFPPPGAVEKYSGVSSYSQSLYGKSSYNQVLVGWNIGGGIEWMFKTNWSLKAEALYWNMGNINLQTISYALSGPTNSGVIVNNTQVNYQGVIARAGINYHFNLGGVPAVASF